MKLPKNYEPHLYEADIYALWEKSDAFKPTGKGKPFSIVVPPPNANGNLHLGHALTMAIEDVAVRFHRLKGDRALLLPGADHAGFETQVVYEKQLAKEGKSRFDFTREELYKNVWDFVAANRSNFVQQYRALGAGVDWDRFTFTLDEKIVKRAYATFQKMWHEGLIYRGERLVNFCTFHGTAFADIEVVHKEEMSHLWHIRYPLTDGSGELIVATTRPETMFGDTAVAVHPDDKRYKKFIGKTIKLPLTNREIPIIADDFVEVSFGTGAVKITPAHDPNDFEAGKRHDLPMITVIDHEGKMNAETPEGYRGLGVEAARKQVVSQLAEQGLLTKTEELPHNVGHCYKCDTVIQPLLREQWFVDMKPLAGEAIKALEAGKVTFYPESKKHQLITYLDNLRDWNISRQIAWGIPIPAFQNVDNSDDWIYDERVDQEIIEVDGKTYRRDPDVFDTWFSSSSWPYATLNYGDPKSTDFEDFYPISLMETGFDILYPWVSRMLMFGLYVTGEVPFKAVYLHGLVLDEHGQKMSKSKGNVVNPMEVIDEYGSDAVRMGVLTGTSPGNNQPFGVSKVIGARNFCNKLWNIARYIEDKLDGEDADITKIEPQTLADHWLLSKLHDASEEIGQNLEDYRFSEAYETLYHFVWDEFADWYIEASKAQPNLPLLGYALKSILQMTHPFAPFVTETIWQTLNWENTLIATSSWPTVKAGNTHKTKEFDTLQTLITEVRAIVKNIGIKDGTLLHKKATTLDENSALVKQLARLHGVVAIDETPENGLKLTQVPLDAWLDIEPQVAKAHLAKLNEQQAVVEAAIGRLEQRLGNKSYVANAPEQVVAQTREQLEEASAQLAAIKAEQSRFA